MTASSPVYVAPATEALTVPHIRDPLGQNKDLDGDGVTACGRLMLHAECWQAVELRDGDRVHPACLGETEPEVEGLF